MTDQPPVARRINAGTGHSYTLDGHKIDGATRILEGGYPKPGLVHWAADEARKAVIDRWDELVALEPSARGELVYKARFDNRDEAAERGKRAHALIQTLAREGSADVPDELSGYLDAYLRFVDDWRPREILIEAPVFSIQFRYAGTLDVIADLADGQRWLLDWKTGKRIYPDVALQLAAYRYADCYLDAAGELQPMPRVDCCGSVWIQDGLYELRPITVTPDDAVVFGAAQQVAQWRALNDKWPAMEGWPIGAALEPPTQEAA